MALRMSVCEAKGVVAWGRVRDVAELQETGLPVGFFNPIVSWGKSRFWQYTNSIEDLGQSNLNNRNRRRSKTTCDSNTAES